MTSILTDDIEINIEESKWRLFNLQGKNSLTPYFYTVRGARLLYYTSNFAETSGLPGTVLSADYVQAVVVGYDEKNTTWRLGIQVTLDAAEKPRFVELVRWPKGDSEEIAADSHMAGRVLAEFVSVPLKLFGVKKAVAPVDSTCKRIMPTLQPNRRAEVDVQRVSEKAISVQLPISQGSVWIGAARNGITMRLSKEDSKGSGEAPAFNQVVIDKDSQTIRMMPPTGLLGAFLGPQGRVINYHDVSNVELRHTTQHLSSTRRGDDGLAEDETTTTEIFGIYLILPDEAVLLVQRQHSTTSDLKRRKQKTRTSVDGDYDHNEEIAYLRQHQEDQQKRDEIAAFVEDASHVVAAAMGKSVVNTEVGEERV